MYVLISLSVRPLLSLCGNARVNVLVVTVGLSLPKIRKLNDGKCEKANLLYDKQVRQQVRLRPGGRFV